MLYHLYTRTIVVVWIIIFHRFKTKLQLIALGIEIDSHSKKNLFIAFLSNGVHQMQCGFSLYQHASDAIKTI